MFIRIEPEMLRAGILLSGEAGRLSRPSLSTGGINCGGEGLHANMNGAGNARMAEREGR